MEYESLGEATIINLLDHDPNCYLIESQPKQLPNKSGKGKLYTIDILATPPSICVEWHIIVVVFFTLQNLNNLMISDKKLAIGIIRGNFMVSF